MSLNRIVLYVKDVEKTVAFYGKYFRFTASRQDGDRIVELVGDQGGASLMIHPQAKAKSPGRRWCVRQCPRSTRKCDIGFQSRLSQAAMMR